MLQFPYGANPNNGVSIDGQKENIFTCIISGTICIAYQISIFDNNTQNLVYSGEKNSVNVYNGEELKMNIPPSSFENGKDLIWKIRLWTNLPDMKIISGKTLEGSTLTDIKVRDYKIIKEGYIIKIGGETRTILSYENGTIKVDSLNSIPEKDTDFQIYSDFIDTPYYFFKSRSAPIISIENFNSQINDRKYNFIGSYSQSENSSIQYYIFNLYGPEDELIGTTGKVFNANIKYSFDGFNSNTKYKIELICMSQDNVEVSTGKKEFDVVYSAPNIDISPSLKVSQKEDGVQVFWRSQLQSIPDVYGEYEIIENFPFYGTNSVYLKNNSYLNYKVVDGNPLNIDDENFTVLISTCLNDEFVGKIIELNGESGEYYIGFDGSYFFYCKNNVITNIYTPYVGFDFVTTFDGIPIDKYGYVWIDEKKWNDEEIWTESTLRLSQEQYKITIKPEYSNVTKVV